MLALWERALPRLGEEEWIGQTPLKPARAIARFFGDPECSFPARYRECCSASPGYW